MRLALFDLANTLLAGDSDYEWAQYLIDQGVLERDGYEARNNEFYEQYKAGVLDIYEFLDFQLKPLAQYPRATLDSWHRAFMQERILPIIRTETRELIARHRADLGSQPRVVDPGHRAHLHLLLAGLRPPGYGAAHPTRADAGWHRPARVSIHVPHLR